MLLKELVAKRDALANDMREMHKKSEKDDKPFTSEQREQWDGMKKDLESHDERIARSKEMESLDDPMSNVHNGLEQENTLNTKKDDDKSEGEKRYSVAFDKMLRGGMNAVSGEERTLLEAQFRAQSQGTGSEGGFAVPKGFGDRVIETIQSFGGIMGAATIINTEGSEEIPFPTVDDTANEGTGEQAENSAVAGQDVVFGEKSLNGYIYPSGIVQVSLKLLASERVDLEGLLAGLMGKRIGRRSSSRFAVGTGVGQPEGITIGAGAGATAAAASVIAYQDLTALEASVDVGYQNGANFVFNQGTLKALKDIVDGDGRPLWLPSLASTAPSTLMGYSYILDNGMPSLGTGNIPVVFGDISQYFIRQAGDLTVQRLVERYAEFLQVGFIAHALYDGAVMDASGIKKLTMA